MSLFQDCSPCSGESSHSKTMGFFQIVMIRVMCERVQLKICGKPCLGQCTDHGRAAEGSAYPMVLSSHGSCNICSSGRRKMGAAIVAKLELSRGIWYSAVASSEMGCAGGTATG